MIIETVLLLLLTADIIGIAADYILFIAAGLISLIVWFHKRLSEIEKNNTEKSASLYGAEKDKLNKGIIHEVDTLREEITKHSEKIEEIEEKLKQLED